jgi:hypothetical protein
MHTVVHDAMTDGTDGGCTKALPHVNQDVLNGVMERRGGNRPQP